MRKGNAFPDIRQRGHMASTEDPTVIDLRRELRKAREALAGAQTHLARHAEMNAALHCAERVMYSPLHAKVTAAMASIDHALERTQPAVTAMALQPLPEHSDSNCPWVGLIADFDRCQHGRHVGDPCGSCGTNSHGNPHMVVGDIVGYDVHAHHIVMPDRDHKHDPAAWRQKDGA